MEISKWMEEIIILAIRGGGKWKRLPVTKKDRPKIKDVRAKNKIKCKYPNAKLNEWRKEYTRYRHVSGFIVEIHRFYNTRNHKEEFDVKIKRPRCEELINQLIKLIEFDLGILLSEETKEQIAVTIDNEKRN